MISYLAVEVRSQNILRENMRRFSFLFVLLIFGHIPSFSAELNFENIDRIVSKDSALVFRDQKISTFRNNALLRDTISLFTQMKDLSEQDGNITFVSGCRVHSCQEKGMVAVDEKSQNLKGVALLSYNCRLLPYGASAGDKNQKTPVNSTHEYCETAPTLRIFVIRRDRDVDRVNLESKILNRFREWGKTFAYKDQAVEVWDDVSSTSNEGKNSRLSK
jgi:hypothetical protein